MDIKYMHKGFCTTLCVRMYICVHSWVAAGLSYKPVETDLDGASWLSLNDPLTTQGIFVVAWPTRGEDDTRQP